MTLAKTAKQIAADPEAQYQALQRSLRRRKGFGLLFVQATPAKASEVLQRLHHDLPQKNIGTLVLDQPITNLYNLVAQRTDLADLNILFIQGLEKSLEADIKPGYGGEGDYYNLDTVPPLLSHLNQQRDNFRDHFGHLCFVFVVPPFALKYLIRRAADFFDWRSGIFTFSDSHAGEHQVQTQIDQGEEVENSNWQAIVSFFESNAKYEAGDYAAAIAAYDAALEIKPDYHEALNNKGSALGNLGQYEAAIACFDAALAIKPDKYAALDNKGVALGNLGQYEAAIACHDAALEIKSDYHEALTNKGIALAYLGQHEAAIAAYDAALEIKPDDPNSLYNKACCYGLQGDADNAIQALQAAIALDPKYRDMAKTDTDFDLIRTDERFQALLAGEQVSVHLADGEA